MQLPLKCSEKVMKYGSQIQEATGILGFISHKMLMTSPSQIKINSGTTALLRWGNTTYQLL